MKKVPLQKHTTSTMKSIKQKLLYTQCKDSLVSEEEPYEQHGRIIHELILKLGSNINEVIRQLLCKD